MPEDVANVETDGSQDQTLELTTAQPRWLKIQIRRKEMKRASLNLVCE